MDLRIVNTCDNNCLYCLEQSYRNRIKFIDKKKIFKSLDNDTDKNITFYGGNPLLHPDIIEIIKYSKEKGYSSIGILTNSKGLNLQFLDILVNNGLNSIGIYFNNFDKTKHNIIVNGGINLDSLLDNLSLFKKYEIYKKVIIHINKININSLYKDIVVLNKKYGFLDFEFINYFPFDRPYDLYKDKLDYNEIENKENINKMFLSIKKLNLKAKFYKFPKYFFGENTYYYDYKKGIIDQIGEEDIQRLDIKGKPFCLLESRCNSCFIRDNCKFYV